MGQVAEEFARLQSPCFVPVLLSLEKLKSKLSFTVTISKMAAFSEPAPISSYIPSLPVYLIPVSATDPLFWLLSPFVWTIIVVAYGASIVFFPEHFCCLILLLH